MSTTTSDPQTYYRAGGRRVPLTPDPDLIALRYAHGLAATRTAMDERAARLLRSAVPEAFIPNHGVQILRAPGVGADGHQAVMPLDRDSRVDFAAPLFRVEDDPGNRVVVLPHVVVQFGTHLQRSEIDELLERFGAQIVEARPFLGNAFVVRAAEGFGPAGPVALANLLVDEGYADKASPDIVRRIETRSIATGAPAVAVGERAPEFDAEQWHLDVANVRAAWSTTRGGGVAVAVLDDGIAVDHPEFAGKVRAERDFTNGAASASPSSPADRHGTPCAGVAVARGVKASGAAPDAELIAVKTPLWLGTVEEVEMFRWVAHEGAGVISCSWGPAQPYALPDITEEVLRWCANDARDGLGIPIFFAAGNESEDMSTDGYAASEHVIAVAASTDMESAAPYSDFGNPVDIAAPSNGGTRGIFTTDLPGADGYNHGDPALGDGAGDYTNSFGGTSSATPLAAGIAALVLSANPALSAADVRDVLLSTADKIGSPGDYTDGHSPRFGYGRVNAGRAVSEAVGRLGIGPTGGGSTPAEPETGGDVVRYPSGATFARVEHPDDGQDYTDPVANGLIPLIDTSGRLDERIAENFQLREFVPRSSRYRYARVSPELVAGLQAMRTAAGAAMSIRSGYRPPAVNSSVGGAKRSQHLVGRAADIRITGLKPFEVAELALQHLGTDIGLGLGSSIVHVDLRGTLATWTYSGAELGEDEFDAWARQRARQLGRFRGERSEVTDRDWPGIVGPGSWVVGEEPPSFRVYSGQNEWVAVELATDPNLFWPSLTGMAREPSNFVATWEAGLERVAHGSEVTITPPARLWARLTGATHIYYRAVTAADDSGSWPQFESSLALEEATGAPSMEVQRTARHTDWLGDADHRRHVEARWRNGR